MWTFYPIESGLEPHVESDWTDEDVENDKQEAARGIYWRALVDLPGLFIMTNARGDLYIYVKQA